MSAVAPALLAVAAGVGVGHAVLPDHWMPLAVVGRVNRLSTRKVARIAALAGLAHVLVSVILGAIIILVGLQFRSVVDHTQDAIVGALLLCTGVGFAVAELLGRGHHHGPERHRHGPPGHTHPHAADHRHHDHERSRASSSRIGRLQILIPFGAAASPDLTILPVFLAATASGIAAAIGALVAFALATVGTIVLLTTAAFASGYRLRGDWLNRWGNMLTASVLLVIGALVAAGVI